MKEESEKVGLKLNIQKTKIMASGPITSWEIDGKTVSDFIFLGSKITTSPGVPAGRPHTQIWNNDLTISLLHSADMRPYNWSYTQFSQFNQDDSLLLASGVFLGPHNSSSGEIAVISLGKRGLGAGGPTTPPLTPHPPPRHLCPFHWQAESYHQGNPILCLVLLFVSSRTN